MIRSRISSIEDVLHSCRLSILTQSVPYSPWTGAHQNFVSCGALFDIHRHASVVRVVALLVLLVVSVVVSLYVILLVLLLVAISFSSLFVPCWTFQGSPMYQVFCTVFIIGLPESVVNLFWWSPLAPSTLTLKKSRSKQNLNLKARNHTRMMRACI